MRRNMLGKRIVEFNELGNCGVKAQVSKIVFHANDGAVQVANQFFWCCIVNND